MQPDDNKMMLVCHLLLVNLQALFPASVWVGPKLQEHAASFVTFVSKHCCAGKWEIGGLIFHALCFIHSVKKGASNCTRRDTHTHTHTYIYIYIATPRNSGPKKAICLCQTQGVRHSFCPKTIFSVVSTLFKESIYGMTQNWPFRDFFP